MCSQIIRVREYLGINLTHCSQSFIPKKITHIRAGFIELKTGDKLRVIFDGIKQNTMYFSHFRESF